jgi:hypothetical protein
MSEPDNFLSRWSRRKLEPSPESDKAAPALEQTVDAQAGDAVPQVAAAVPADAEHDQTQELSQEPPFDAASLPPIESITAGTDIRDFLKPGVPLSLSRAALRRAWTSDPAIRDFIGIAENQWDFTNDSIPGFGPIDPADIPRLLARIISSTKDGGEALAAFTEEQPGMIQPAPPETPVAKVETVPAEQTAGALPSQQLASPEEPVEEISHRSKENVASQTSDVDAELNYAQVRHGHGSALPT